MEGIDRDNILLLKEKYPLTISIYNEDSKGGEMKEDLAYVFPLKLARWKKMGILIKRSKFGANNVTGTIEGNSVVGQSDSPR